MNVPSVPPSYTGPTALIKDTVMPYEATKVDFFYLAEINGKKVQNSSLQTYMANQNNGLNAISVWIEDEATHQVLDHKIEVRPAVVAAPEPVEHIDFPGGAT